MSARWENMNADAVSDEEETSILGDTSDIDEDEPTAEDLEEEANALAKESLAASGRKATEKSLDATQLYRSSSERLRSV